MTGNLSIAEIKYRLGQAAADFTSYCSALSNEQFFYQPGEKWSAAQQVKHLITATDTARLAFTLPKFMVRIVGGKPNRPSRTYDELVAKYKLKLEQGGRASGRYIPKPVPASFRKEKMLGSFTKSMQRFEEALQKNWKEPQPDQYIAPHPLLGKITLRELCYFTIHHTYHHLGSIQKIAVPD
ncbi:MAG: DinB family protein [Bacteroidota bacterium]